jgi:hypothetical protein
MFKQCGKCLAWNYLLNSPKVITFLQISTKGEHLAKCLRTEEELEFWKSGSRIWAFVRTWAFINLGCVTLIFYKFIEVGYIYLWQTKQNKQTKQLKSSFSLHITSFCLLFVCFSFFYCILLFIFDIFFHHYYFFHSAEAWTQGLHLEPLHDHFFDGFFQDKVLQTICQSWLWTVILLMSASWVARITGMSYRCQPYTLFF